MSGDLSQRWIRRHWRLPSEAAPRPVSYSAVMLAYVGVLIVAAGGVAALTLRSPNQVGALALGGAMILLFAVTSVSVLSGVDSYWSASGFAHLGLSLAVGPPGALLAALSDAAGGLVRFRSGWFRAVFNAAGFFLSDIGAWAVFRLIHDDRSDFITGISGGLCAGAAQFGVNIGLLTVVQRISHPGLDVADFLRGSLQLLPYHLGYGCAAFGAVLLVDRAGAGGLLLMLMPVLMLQLFLVVLASRTLAAEEQRAAHAREREQLLQRALEASDAERRRIGRNLHDGVVQELAAISLGLRNHARRGAGDSRESVGTMLRAADATSAALDELRHLLVEISPSHVEEIGLAGALDELAEPLRQSGVTVLLSVDPSATRAPEAQQRALHRIAQESLRNVTKHANASQVSIAVLTGEDAIQLEIIDDGRGSSAEERTIRRREGHIGLSLLHDLAREAGGDLDVASELRHGTRVRARLPIT